MDTGVAGWSGTIPAFIDEESAQIRLALEGFIEDAGDSQICLLYTSPSPRDRQKSRMPSSA